MEEDGEGGWRKCVCVCVFVCVWCERKRRKERLTGWANACLSVYVCVGASCKVPVRMCVWEPPQQLLVCRRCLIDTVTHCNTLQHSVTHCNICNTLQYIATSWITPGFAEIRRVFMDTAKHAATRCNTLQYTSTHCNTCDTPFLSTVRARWDRSNEEKGEKKRTLGLDQHKSLQKSNDERFCVIRKKKKLFFPCLQAARTPI